ncbi:12304_t:CDS:2, partial [Entrophospora sp. SA101]
DLKNGGKPYNPISVIIGDHENYYAKGILEKQKTSEIRYEAYEKPTLPFRHNKFQQYHHPQQNLSLSSHHNGVDVEDIDIVMVNDPITSLNRNVHDDDNNDIVGYGELDGKSSNQRSSFSPTSKSHHLSKSQKWSKSGYSRQQNSVVLSGSPDSNQNNSSTGYNVVLSNITTSIAVGSTFLNWEQVDEVLELYGREKGFVVRKKRVERDDMGMVRKRTYDCEHGGRYTPKKKAAIHEQRNRTSKRIECGWHINLSFPKTSSHITAASPKNRNLPKAVLEDIEFYTIHGNLGVTTQRQLLKAKYPNHQLPARDISNAVQKFKGVIDLKSLDNDAPKLWIWELARKATQIALDHQDNTLEELLKSYIREKEDLDLLGG